MAAYAGTTLAVVLVDDGNTVLAGIRNLSCKGSAGVVDVTNRDSVGGWREVLSECGRINLTVSGQMVFVDDATQEQLHADHVNRTVKRYRFRISPGGFSLLSDFRITEFEVSGEYEDAVMVNFTMETAGAVTYTDLA